MNNSHPAYDNCFSIETAKHRADLLTNETGTEHTYEEIGDGIFRAIPVAGGAEFLTGEKIHDEARNKPKSNYHKALPESGFTFINSDELAVTAKAPNYLINDILETDSHGILGGASMAFKTFVAVRLAHSICTGKPFMGREVFYSGKVLMACGEGQSALSRRIKAVKIVEGDFNGNLFVLNESVRIDNKSDMERLRLEIIKHKPALLIFDTFASLVSDTDENSPSDTGRALRLIKETCRNNHTSSLIIHHHGKDAAKGLRGASNFTNDVDFSFSLEREADSMITTMTCRKMKDGDNFEEIHMEARVVELRPYQHGAINNLRVSIGAGNKRVLLQAATGAGKTIIACEMIRLATMKQKRVIFIAHRKEIINQTSGKLDAFGIEHGVIMANHSRVNNHGVQVASIQTLTRRDKPPADLIIIDETHLACSASFKQILNHYSGATVIGLTATPTRLDGKGLGEIYSDIIQVIPMAKLIGDGHLVKPRVFAPFTPNMKGVRTIKGDYDAIQTAKLMDRKEITADIVKHWIKSTLKVELNKINVLGKNINSAVSAELNKINDLKTNYRKTIVFASSVEHSKNIVSEFIESGISAKHLDANTPATERDQTLQDWRDGKFTVLSNMGLFVEGLDVPAASCCILARPTKSVTIYLQAVGRVMRPHESKTDCIILDCAGLTYEHGFVDDAREWTLNGKIKKPKDEEPKAHICENCFAAYSKAQHPHECPECGFETPIEHKEIEQADVEMVELTPSIVAQLRAKRAKFLEQTKCKTLDDFKELAQLRGYKIGWAYIKWVERKAWLEKNGYPVPNEK